MSNRQQRSVRFGVNYTPSRRWYYCWNDWSLDEIEADLDAIASLGVDHLRLQLIWPSFQPNATWVSPGHLDRLRQFMAASAAREIDVLVTLLTGFLSSYVFLPPFVRAKQKVFTDGRVFEAEVFFAREVLSAVADAPNFMGLDVGNEINCLAHDLPTDAGDDWARRFTAAVQPHTRGRPIVNGIDHTPVFAGTTFSMDHLANDYPFISLHTWPKFTGALGKGALDDAPNTHLTAFCTDLIRLYADDPARPVWIQEFGACDLWGSTDQQQAFMAGAIENGIHHGASVFTWWCSHDKTRDVTFPDTEYVYGLFTPDNEAKPLAGTYRALIERFAAADRAAMAIEPDCRVVVPDGFEPRFLKKLPGEQYTEQQLATSTWKLYDVYLQQLAAGKSPVLVREGDADDGEGDVVRPGAAGLMSC